jgi:hypothetical protein
MPVDTPIGGSQLALVMAHRVLARVGPAALADRFVWVPLEHVDDIRELAYLALELQYCSPEDTTLRLVRWLRRHAQED